jgi:hypothetical protein
MTISEDAETPNAPRWRWPDWIVAVVLLGATAAVVVWQNSRVGVLWDLSYVLENSYRVSLGDFPYRDFPFPHAPLTFLIQATLIKLTRRVFWHHVLYCATAGGLGTVLTWRIVFKLMRGTMAHARLLAFLLSVPLIALGIYCVFPHPFYDPDCTLAILVSILSLLQIESRRLALLRAFVAGVSVVIPLFVKQNVGLAFFASVMLALIALTAIAVWQRRSVRSYVSVFAGIVVGLIAAIALIHFTAGLQNYWHWTIQFAAARRTPSRADMLEIYESRSLMLWLAILFAGGGLCWLANRRGNRTLRWVAGLLTATPFAWPVVYLLLDRDSSERADRLLGLWPIVLIASFVTAVITLKRRKGVALIVPFIIIVTVHGAFISQQLWGSTYAIWPLLMILIASAVIGLHDLAGKAFAPTAIPLTAVITLSLIIAGTFYVRSEERLDYVNLSDGEMVQPTLPQLQGLSIRGRWITDFEELIRYTDREIPRGDVVLVIPGEDLFFYTTGRHPRFPVQLFDRTTNPYSPEQIVQLCSDYHIRWVIVKQELQLEDDQIDQDKDRLADLLENDFEQVETLNNYDIYRRNESPESPDSSEPDDPSGN